MKPVALYYLALLDDMRACAASLGYALGLHGSMQRDFDLIACPWTEGARPHNELMDALARLVKGNWHPSCVDEKPHGRRAWAIHIGWHDELKTTTIIDISIMPLLPPKISGESP